jgi:hypothetical protein
MNAEDRALVVHFETECRQPSQSADPVMDVARLIERNSQTKRRACDEIVRACANASYYSGGVYEDLGIAVNCLEPLRTGKMPPRVHLARSTLEACFGPALDDKEGIGIAADQASKVRRPEWLVHPR